MRTQEEINAILDNCLDHIDAGTSRFPSMTYEEGVQAAIDWVTGQTDDNPYPEE